MSSRPVLVAALGLAIGHPTAGPQAAGDDAVEDLNAAPALVQSGTMFHKGWERFDSVLHRGTLDDDGDDPVIATKIRRLGVRVDRALNTGKESSAASFLQQSSPPLQRRAMASRMADSWQTIRDQNYRSGCVTVKSPLARSTFIFKIAPIGTPCLFRADAQDEHAHCINVESGKYGQFGWCWTNLDRTQWGSCSPRCPMPGSSKVLGDRLDRVEHLLDDLELLVERRLGGKAPRLQPPGDARELTPIGDLEAQALTRRTGKGPRVKAEDQPA